MIRVAVVDDEYHVLERFRRLFTEIEEVSLKGLFTSGADLLTFIRQESLDAVFLDVEMPNMNGMALTAEILNYNPGIEIIFVTAFQKYAVEAFELHALDYLLKPVSLERLKKTVLRIHETRKPAIQKTLIYIQCFTEFELYINGKIMIWKNSKAKEILAFLVYKKGIPQRWQKIATAVWPDFDTERAHTNFHSTMYLLRKALMEAGADQILENTRGNYRICRDTFSCDAYRFENLAEQALCGNISESDKVVLDLLYRGSYMEETGYEWAYSKAAELEELKHKIMKWLDCEKIGEE